MLISKECLITLKRISKAFNRKPLPIGSFSITDEAHITALRFGLNSKDAVKSAYYDLSVIPDLFIKYDNNVVLEDAFVRINDMKIPAVQTESWHYEYKLPSMDDKGFNFIDNLRTRKIKIDGRLLKNLFTLNGTRIKFVTDRQSSRVEIFDDKTPILSYRTGEGLECLKDDDEIASSFNLDVLDDYKTIIPNQDVNVTYRDDCVLMLDWIDDTDNRYELFFAPVLTMED